MFDSESNQSPSAERLSAARSRRDRAFLGVLFNCCNQYARIYQRADGLAYAGHCPRCGKSLTVPIGPGGSGQRFFGTTG